MAVLKVSPPHAIDARPSPPRTSSIITSPIQTTRGFWSRFDGLIMELCRFCADRNGRSIGELPRQLQAPAGADARAIG
jgi:hypothetical protein